MPSGLVKAIEVLGHEDRIHRHFRGRACERLDQKVQELVQEGFFTQDEVFRAADQIYSTALSKIGRGGEVSLLSLNPEEMSQKEQRQVKLLGILLRATKELSPYVKTCNSWWGFGSPKRNLVAVAPSLTVRRVVHLGLFRDGKYIGKIRSEAP